MLPVLAVSALGLPFISFTSLALRAFYAQQDTRTPVRAAALSFVVNLGLSLALMGPWSTVGLAVAGNVAVVAQAAYLQAHLARKHAGFGLAGLWPNLAKIAVGVGVMAGVVGVAAWAVAALGLPGAWPDLVVVLGVIPLGAATYAGVLWGLRIEGREDLARWLRLGARGAGQRLD